MTKDFLLFSCKHLDINMTNIIGYTYLPYSKKEKIQLKINKFLKKDFFNIANKKMPLYKTNKNVVYLFGENKYDYNDSNKYHFNYIRHCFSQLEEHLPFVLLIEDSSQLNSINLIEDICYHKNKYGNNTCFFVDNNYYIQRIENKFSINFFNDLFDNLSESESFHILSEVNKKSNNVKLEITHVAKTLLYFLCVELKKVRQRGDDIDSFSIKSILEQFELFTSQAEYIEQLKNIQYEQEFSLLFKHQLIKDFCIQTYFSKLFELEFMGIISNKSCVTLPKILEYGYNYVAIKLPLSIKNYLNYLLGKKSTL